MGKDSKKDAKTLTQELLNVPSNGIALNSTLVSLPFCYCFCNSWTFPDRFLELTDYNTNVALKIKLLANINLQRGQILQPYKNQFLNIGISFD